MKLNKGKLRKDEKGGLVFGFVFFLKTDLGMKR